MPIHAPIVNLSPQVRDAFDEGCRAVFKTTERRALAGRETLELLWRFAAHYQRLIVLPRRTRRSIERRWKRTLSAIALLMTLGLAPASAAVIEVSPGTPPSINADGKCSLSEAIVNANRNARTHLDCVGGAGLDTIMLPANSQQPLAATESLPQITSPIVIEGHHSTVLRNSSEVSGGFVFFHVSASGDLTLNTTTVSGATVTARGTYRSGIGVFNDGGSITLNNSSLVDTAGGLRNDDGTAVLNDSAVSGSHRPHYGYSGIQNRGGTLTLRNCVVTGNASTYDGGGIRNHPSATATVIDSIVSQNRACCDLDSYGGGIANGGTLILIGSTVSDNFAAGGGGILNFGSLTARRSTISGNRAHGGDYGIGGAGILHTSDSPLTLINSTVSNNVGGGVANYGGEVIILSSTVTGNIAGGRGAGLSVHEGGTVTLKRSIVSGNSAPTGREIYVDADVVVRANDFNLFGREGDAGVAGFTPGSTDIVPNEPLGGILLPLADNGGDTDTRTHALAIGSPALDASPDDATCPAVDQRGSPRPRGPACDIGSFEGSAVLCNGRVTTMVGTDGPDELTGTPGADVISGLSGNDAIVGLEGKDVICAGGGADRVYGGIGNDVLFGEFGNDQLFGQRGNDTLNGGAGQDECDGGSHTGAGDNAATCETVINVP